MKQPVCVNMIVIFFCKFVNKSVNCSPIRRSESVPWKHVAVLLRSQKLSVNCDSEPIRNRVSNANFIGYCGLNASSDCVRMVSNDSALFVLGCSKIPQFILVLRPGLLNLFTIGARFKATIWLTGGVVTTL